MVNEEVFIKTMMCEPLTEYGKRVVSMYNSLSTEDKERALDVRRVKDACCEVERLYELMCLPEFKNDTDYVDEVMIGNEILNGLYADEWFFLDEDDKYWILCKAASGYPFKREGKEIWFNLMGILYSMIVGDDDGE